ncbi:lysophospholipase-like protein 1 isoform X2 [Phyllobates terribilis]|uniref:lysophospholipase-like protein 1 isoform X2 n=1 Tax=Phyllobates terribilis TaxID=111132 RepID=UPI003CCACD03
MRAPGSHVGVMAASLSRCVVSPAGKHSASVIFLHGSGDTGPGIKSWIREILKKDLAFSHIKVIFPTAPARPYTPMNGGISNVWFDRHKISIDSPEHLDSVNSMCQVLTDLIREEMASGISKNRILLETPRMGRGFWRLNSSLLEEAEIRQSFEDFLQSQVDFQWVAPWLCTWPIGTIEMFLGCLLYPVSLMKTQWFIRNLKRLRRPYQNYFSAMDRLTS